MVGEQTSSLDYPSILETSRRVNWHLDEVIAPDQSLDFARPFLPEALVRVASISCLNAAEQLTLNQIRGNSYLHWFALCETFILPVVEAYTACLNPRDRDAVAAFHHFAEEERKHIDLFRQFAQRFQTGFGWACDCVEPVSQIRDAVLRHHPLAIALLILHVEWITQRHYVESVRDNQVLDPHFSQLLRCHWLEEAQHTKLDTRMIQHMAHTLTPHQIEEGIDDYFETILLLNEALKQQVWLDIISLERATGRYFSMDEALIIRRIQEASYQWMFLGSGMTHQPFIRMVGELSPAGQMRLLEMSNAFC